MHAFAQSNRCHPRHQPHAQRLADPGDGVKARLRIGFKKENGVGQHYNLPSKHHGKLFLLVSNGMLYIQ